MNVKVPHCIKSELAQTPSLLKYRDRLHNGEGEPREHEGERAFLVLDDD